MKAIRKNSKIMQANVDEKNKKSKVTAEASYFLIF